MGFFQEAQGAGVFKLAVLSRYLPTFISKVGRFAPGHRVAYLDGFAGPGGYEDGTPGSPSLALDTAKALAAVRDVDCYFVELDISAAKRLQDRVEKGGLAKHATVRHGAIGAELSGLLTDVGDAPLLAFLDPFGLGLAFDQLTEQLLGRRGAGRSHSPATEVLVNFVHAGVYRNAGKLAIKSDDPAQIASARTIVELVDANLGGTWWHGIWLGPQGAVQKVAAIREEYIRRVLDRAGSAWRSYRVAISDSWKGQPIYDLILFTQHLQGPWFFNEAVSLGRETFKEHTMPAAGSGPALVPLWTEEDEWVDRIAENLRRMLGAGKPVPLLPNYEAVYGNTLGYARQTHVRKAVKRIYQQGLTPTTGVGPVHAMTIHPALKPRRTAASGGPGIA